MLSRLLTIPPLLYLWSSRVLGQLKVSRNGRSYTYHRLLESVRTDKGPRQRLVLSLGTLDLPKSEWPRLAERIEDLLNHQELIPFGSCDLDQLAAPFAERIRHKQQRRRAQQEGQGPAKEVYPERSGSEHIRELGPEYVAHVFWERLHCDQLLQRCGLSQRQCRLAEIQVVGRLLAPRSERGTVGWFARTALAELMPGSVASVNKDALYRISDQLYAHRVAIETGLAARERELFALQETIILYDLSSTYFEGIAARNEKAEHGYSRDHRPDCKQVVVGLVLDGEGFPKAHEVFTGNTKDETSLARMRQPGLPHQRRRRVAESADGDHGSRAGYGREPRAAAQAWRALHRGHPAKRAPRVGD